MKNPHWIRDELILALDLYFRLNPAHVSVSNSEILALSELLRSLPIHERRNINEQFRSPSSVCMKLSNFLRLDPTYPGKGLSAGSKLDEVVWREFAPNRERLRQVARAIKDNYKTVTRPANLSQEEEFAEGRILIRVHKTRERNQKAVMRKKRTVMKETGTLACEVCGFDFAEVYGQLGEGFAECHHKVPVSELTPEIPIRLSDLAILCANCHRMIHRASHLSFMDFVKWYHSFQTGKKEQV